MLCYTQYRHTLSVFRSAEATLQRSKLCVDTPLAFPQMMPGLSITSWCIEQRVCRSALFAVGDTQYNRFSCKKDLYGKRLYGVNGF